MSALGWQTSYWRSTDAKYPIHVPHLSTYLSAQRWTDEPTTAPRRDVRVGHYPADMSTPVRSGQLDLDTGLPVGPRPERTRQRRAAPLTVVPSSAHDAKKYLAEAAADENAGAAVADLVADLAAAKGAR
jgi:hypothetical protein